MDSIEAILIVLIISTIVISLWLKMYKKINMMQEQLYETNKKVSQLIDYIKNTNKE